MPDEASILTWMEIGDAHLTEAGLQNDRDLHAVVARINAAFSPDTVVITSPEDARLSIAPHGNGSIRAKVWKVWPESPIDAVTCALDGSPFTPMRRIGHSNVWEHTPNDPAARISL